MTARESLTGISAMFTPDEIECLVRAAGDAVAGDLDDLSSRQRTLALRVHDLILNEGHHPDTGPSAQATAQRLVTLAGELNVDQHDLDHLVHDLASKPASEINNGDLSAQVTYLLDQLGEAETEQALRDAADPGTGGRRQQP